MNRISSTCSSERATMSGRESGKASRYRRNVLAPAAVCFGLLVFSIPLNAQWTNIPLPGTPRLADGKPDLSAPAPKTADGKPDLSGVWRVSDGRYLQNIAAETGEAPFQPWA